MVISQIFVAFSEYMNFNQMDSFVKLAIERMSEIWFYAFDRIFDLNKTNKKHIYYNVNIHALHSYK